MIALAEITTGELTTAVVTIIGALVAGVIAILNATRKTHDIVNSRMDKTVADMKTENAKLLETAVESAFNKGMKIAMDAQKAAQPLAAPEIPEVKIVNSPNEPVPTIPIKKP